MDRLQQAIIICDKFRMKSNTATKQPCAAVYRQTERAQSNVWFWFDIAIT